jgi:small subunit ribosomal protein S17
MNNRRRLTGTVTSDKMTKTVVVEITRTYRHPLYKKVVHASNHFKAHNELGAKLGDVVVIVESRPLSRDKRWVVESIVRKESATVVVDASVPEPGDPVTGEGA